LLQGAPRKDGRRLRADGIPSRIGFVVVHLDQKPAIVVAGADQRVTALDFAALQPDLYLAVLVRLGHGSAVILFFEPKVAIRSRVPYQNGSGAVFVLRDDPLEIGIVEGYEQLEELDWEGYRQKYGDIQRLDRILEAEGDTPNRYRLSKQADVLMLFYLFSAEELKEIFQKFGYHFEYETIPKNIDFYIRRTAHGSTLSRVVHSWVLARQDRERSWRLFNEALFSDLTDIQGGTTPEGIHLGAMAGTVDQVQRCYTGIVTRKDTLWLNPCLPEELAKLRLQIRYRGYFLRLEICRDRVKVTSLRNRDYPIRVGCGEKVVELNGRETIEFPLG
jgi:alpha,alpha-trehalase